jgi:flagellar biosynthetic protein FliR
MSMLTLGWFEAVMLASVRLVAFLVVAPPFSHSTIPLQVKGMLGLGLAIAISPLIATSKEPMDTTAFTMSLVMQVIIGLALGFLVMLAFSAIQSAGSLIDLFGGFQLAQAFDPGMLINGAQFTRLFHMTAVVLLFTTDGYQVVIAGITRSFTALPIGTAMDFSFTAKSALTGLTEMFLSAVQIAGPLLIILFLADVGLGLLTRVAPALNAYSLGFPLKVLITLMFAGVVFVGLPRIVASLVEDGIKMMGVS